MAAPKKKPVEMIDGELDRQVDELEALLAQGETISDEMWVEFFQSLDSRAVSLERLAHASLRLGAEAEGCANVAETLRVREKRKLAIAERLRARILGSMLETAVDLPATLDTATVTLTVCNGRKAVEIINEDLVPDAFAEMVRKVSVSQIKKEFEAGRAVEGAMYVTGNPYLQIRS